MSPISNSTDGNTKLKIEPTAAAAASASGKTIHLKIPIVIPPSAITMQKGIQNNEKTSIVARPLVVTAGIDARIGLSPIKVEHDDDDKAPGVGTTDTKTPTNAGSISMSFDAIKDDTMSAIEQALNEGKDTEEIQKITKQRKHMWKSILARAGMNKSFKTIWAEVRQYCEEKHRENERAKKGYVNSSSACKSEDDSSSNSVEGAEVAMKSEAEEECNIHVPLKKRKLPSDYVCALSVKFDEVAMSPTLIKKLKIHGGSNDDGNDEAAARPDDEEISTTVKIKEEEEEEVVVGEEGKRDNGSSTGPNRANGPSLQDVLKALSEDDDDEGDNGMLDIDLKTEEESVGDETAKTEEEGVGEETIPSKQETTQKRKRKPFEFGEWDSIEYFARV